MKYNKRELKLQGPLWKTCANFTHMPMGSILCPHSRLKFKSVLEKSFYTFEPWRGNKSFNGLGTAKKSTVNPAEPSAV